MIIATIALAIGSYLIGAIPFALIVGLRAKGIDIRRHGSGNVGATNALRTLGLLPSLLVFALDFAKGAIPTYVGWTLTGSVTVGAICALCTVIGHNWSVYIRFAGGRGVSTSLGGFCVLLPPAWAIVMVLGVGVIALSRYVSLGSIVGAGVAPLIAIGFLWFGTPPEPAIYAAVAGALVIYRHRDNIRRLLTGKESRIGQKAAGSP